MATSGTVVYTVTESDIISDALEDLGVIGSGETVASADTTKARRKLNMILKGMSAASSFFSGEKFWLRKIGYLFLQKDQGSYSIGPSGNECTASYVQTTLSVAASGGAGTITVTTVTGIANTYRIGIQLDSGSLQWTTVNGAPSGSVVTLTATLTSAAAAGNAVFCYATKAMRPLKLLTAVLRDLDSNDVPMNVNETLEGYEGIANKTNDGDPLELYFTPTLTNATVYMDVEPADVTKVLRYTYRAPIEDMTTGTNNFELPQEAFRYISAQLAIDCAPAFGKEIGPTMKLIRDEALAQLRDAQPQTTDLYFQPGMD
jgi:hypothetical protein